MFKFSFKFLFFLTLIIGTLIAISSSSWLSIWMGLEINLLSFIPLMMMKKNIFINESSMKYFLIQALASSMFFFFVIFYNLMKFSFKIYLNLNLIEMVILTTMMMKMGTAPLHFWFPSVSEGLLWMNNLILMTWQKLAPMVISSYCININLFAMISILCLLFGSMGGLSQTSLRKLMAYSSINHMGWMLMSMLLNETMWMMYFFIYSFLIFNIFYFFNFFKLFYINQLYFLFNFNNFLKILFFLMFFSLGGLPPFLGFFPKWMIMQMLIFNKFYFILIVFLFFTLLTLFFYLRISYSMIFINSKTKKLMFKSVNLKMNFVLFFFCTFFANFSFLLVNFFFNF